MSELEARLVSLLALLLIVGCRRMLRVPPLSAVHSPWTSGCARRYILSDLKPNTFRAIETNRVRLCGLSPDP